MQIYLFIGAWTQFVSINPWTQGFAHADCSLPLWYFATGQPSGEGDSVPQRKKRFTTGKLGGKFGWVNLGAPTKWMSKEKVEILVE